MEAMAANFSEQLVPINEKLEGLGEDIKKNSDTLKKLTAQSVTVDNLRTTVTNQSVEINQLKKQCSQMKDQLNALETHSRRSNVQFLGIPEKRHENCENIVLGICEKIGLDFNERTIERAHRLGKYQEGRTRPIIVRFHHFKDRQAVWATKWDIQTQSNTRIVEDFPNDIALKRRKLAPICEAAYKFRDPDRPDFRYKAWLSADKLVLDNKVYTVDTLDKLPEPLQPKNVFTPSNESAVCFFRDASPLSNHYLADMVVGSNKFNCMEQYLMHAKASKFGDTDSATKVLREPRPAAQKTLGRQVAGYNHDEWVKVLHNVLIQGLTAKFQQNQFCKEFLLSTGSKQIGEAAIDKLYGIGMSLRNPHVLDTARWATDGNVMGKCLMEVRDSL